MATINSSHAVVAKPMRKKIVASRYRSAGFQRELARPVRAGRTSRKVCLLIADSRALIRLGLCAMLAGDSGLSVRGKAGTLAEVVAETRRVRPDLVLLDSQLPGGSGAAACRLLLKEHAEIRIVLMTQDKDTASFRAALKAGAHGVVYKDSSRAELLRAIRLVAGGDSNLNSMAVNQTPRARRQEATPSSGSGLSLLSPQERRILPLIAEGKTNHEIALEMALAERTVKNYIANMFKKLKIGRRTQAAAVYLQA